ncbi:glycosyltransferase [Candidatus Saccharibacteria bacterium]|nr:glycosyltransferase [Candidatus Saccharibacteria bacterium]
MKIAIFSDCYLDLTGGIVTAINAEKAELERRGHTVEVFSTGYPRSKKALAALARQHIFMVPSCRVIGRGATPIPRRPGKIKKWLLRYHPELKGYDIFYVHYEAGCSIAGLSLGRELGIPTVQVMHGREDMAEENLIPRGLRTFVASFLNWCHGLFLPHKVKITKDYYLAPTLARAKMWTLMVNHANYADLVITPSAHFRLKLVSYGVTQPILVLPHGISDEYLHDEPAVKTLVPGQTLEIIWHSRVSPEKRILPFLEALNILQKQMQERHRLTETLGRVIKSLRNEPRVALCHLTVYGSGPDLVRARQYALTHHLNVTFRGKASFDTIWRHLKDSHLDVLASYNYDTFGMTLIEATAAATPVFLVDPDLAEILPEKTYALPSSPTPVEMAESMQKLLENPGLIHGMSARMLPAHASLANSLKIDKLEKIFGDLIKAQFE